MASGNDNNWGLRALGIAAYAVVSVRLYRHFGHRSKKVHHRGSSDIAVSSENENDCSVIELAACDLRDPASGEAYARSAKCTLVGTCHVSSKSQSLVRDTIERIRPQCIAIELCEERRALLRPKPTKALPLTFTDVWRCVWQRGKKDPRDGEKHQNGALQTLLVYLSQFVERRVETKAGTDFIAAFEQAKALRIPLKLVDRTISVTMARATAAMSTFSRIKFLCALGLTMYSVATTPTAATKLKVDQVLNAGEADNASKFMYRWFPQLAEAIVDERDLFLAVALYDLLLEQNEQRHGQISQRDHSNTHSSNTVGDDRRVRTPPPTNSDTNALGVNRPSQEYDSTELASTALSTSSDTGYGSATLPLLGPGSTLTDPLGSTLSTNSTLSTDTLRSDGSLTWGSYYSTTEMKSGHKRRMTPEWPATPLLSPASSRVRPPSWQTVDSRDVTNAQSIALNVLKQNFDHALAELRSRYRKKIRLINMKLALLNEHQHRTLYQHAPITKPAVQIVAVVGKGHLSGIQRYWTVLSGSNEEEKKALIARRDQISQIPSKSVSASQSGPMSTLRQATTAVTAIALVGVAVIRPVQSFLAILSPLSMTVAVLTMENNPGYSLKHFVLAHAAAAVLFLRRPN